MFRIANIIMVIALLVTAAVVYQLKYASTMEAERLANLRASIRKERDAIALMKAEWARRTSPFYIQGLVERHLDLKRLDMASVSDLADLPAKPSDSSDGIGGMIEALVDEPLVTSSVSRSAPAAANRNSDSATLPAASAMRPSTPPPRPANPPAARPRPVATAAPARTAPAPARQVIDPVPPPPPAYYTPQMAAPAPAGRPAGGMAPILPPGSLPGAR